MVAEQPSDRAALRRAMRSLRRSVPAAGRAGHAAAVAEQAVRLLGECGLLDRRPPLTVAATIADDGELDPAPLLEALRGRGARVAYARVVESVMGFALVESPESLVVGPGAVLQPPPDAVAIDPDTLDLVLVPVVAFDSRCERIGRGGGHYDRTFAERRVGSPLLVGLAYDEQRVADVAPMSHDVALDHVVTPTRVFTRIAS